MRKIMSGLMLIGFAGSVFAHNPTPQSCGFIDNMYITAPAGEQILSVTASSGLAVVKNSALEFDIKDDGSCSQGTVTLTVGTDSNNYSTVTLADGAWMWDPNVLNVSNNGNVAYQTMNHDLGSFQYYLVYANNNSQAKLHS